MGQTRGVRVMGQTSWFCKCVTRVGQSEVSDQWVRPTGWVMLMGQSNGSDQWVRPVGHTDGSNQGGQSDGSDQLVLQVCHTSGSE